MVKRQQDVLNEIVKDYIAPTMKTLEFTKNNKRFTKKKKKSTKKKDIYTKILNVYSSQWNTSDEVNFIIELSVNDYADKEIAESRIKRYDGKKEKWYTLTSSVEPEDLGKEIVQDISNYAVPFFEKY